MIRAILMMVALLGSVGVIRAQDAAADFYVEASVDNPNPFVGQQIIYTVRVYQALDLSEASLLYEIPDFEGFWRIDVQPIPFAQTRLQVNNRTYSVSEIRTALYATRAGDLTISPANLVLPETVFRPEQRISSNTVTVTAQLPPAGAPAGFTGAVGHFELLAALDRQSVMLGEPVILRLTVRGTGNLEQLLPPEVLTPQGWQSFANPSSYTTSQDNGHIVGEKVFEWTLFPRQPGSHVLPEISLAYFDPSGLAYRTINTAATTIEVLSANVAATPVESNTVSPINDLLPIKPVPTVLVSAAVNSGWLFWLLWFIPPVGAVVSLWWVRRQQRRQLNQKAIRQAEALQRAQERLQSAVARSGLAYRFINDVILAYFGDKLNCPPDRLNLDDLHRVLSERKIAPEISRRVFRSLERTHEAQYAPTSAVDARQLAAYVLDTLKLLDAAWEQP